MDEIYYKTCYVIMPFSDTQDGRTEKWWTDFFESFLKPILERKGFRAIRSEARTGKITKDIVQDLAYYDLVLAILTDNNANVWYELGIRHSSRFGTIMAIMEPQKPASDLSDYGMIIYKDEADFEKKLQSHIDSIPRKDSPVADFLNSGPYVAINLAVGTLRDTAHIVKQTFANDQWEPVIKALNDYRAAHQHYDLQISVVKDQRLLFHYDLSYPDIKECWKDVVERDVSFLPTMLNQRNGLRIGAIKGFNDRMTVLAFETLLSPHCLIVTEAHYWQVGARPYD